MRIYNKNEILFSIHIPKTAGTSFTKILHKWFWPGLHAHYYNQREDIQPLKLRPIKKLAHSLGVYPLCINGHFEPPWHVFDYYPKANQFLTIVRDPLEMQLSFYHFQKKRITQGEMFWKGIRINEFPYKDVNDFLDSRPPYLLQFFPWNLTLTNFKSVLGNNFIHIGVTEKLQNSIDIMAQKLGKKTIEIGTENRTKRLEEPSKKAVSIFKRKHAVEYKIYDWAMELNS